jgi:hypothetical protein
MGTEQLSIVRLKADERRLHRSAGGAIWFPIWLSWDADNFPGEEWEDIGVDIISAIAAYLVQAPSRQSAIVQFPDGPFRIVLGPADRAALHIRFENYVDKNVYADLKADFGKFLQSVRLCASRILAGCKNNGWSGTRVDEIQRAAESLGRYRQSAEDLDRR